MVLLRALRVSWLLPVAVALVAMSAHAAEEPEGSSETTVETPPAPPPAQPPAPGATATPPGIDPTVGEKAETLRSIELTGTLRESQERLLRFLSLAPGVVFDVDLRDRTRALLRQLGYRLVEIGVEDGTLRIKLALIRNVWWVRVKGNFPYFDDEILRHLSLRSGSEVEDDDNLEAKLAEESKTIERFLERDGYFGSKVEIQPKRIGNDRVDLLVRVRLGTWFKLGSIDVRGSSMLRTGELFDAFDHCCFALGRFRPSSLRNDARTAEKKLRDRGYPGARVEPDFSLTRDVDVQAGKVRLPVEVSEKRKVEVVLIGNRSLQTRELRSELTLFSGVGYSRRDVEENAELLQRAAQRRGFFEAKVDYKITRRADNSDLVEFFIQEGVELRVRGVDFSTQDLSELPVPADQLKRDAELETKVFPRLGVVGLGEGGYVTTVQLQQDEERLVEYFRVRGYPEAKVRAEVARSEATFGALGALGAESATQQSGNNIYVRFFLDLGRREIVEGVTIEFKGEHRKETAEVRKMIRDTVPGKPFTEGALAADQVRILDLYKSSGRPYVEISPPKLDWNEAHDRVRITLTIAEGNDVRFGEILVRGNFRTRERVLLKDLPFKRGDLFDLRKIEEGERNLQNHLIFNSVKVLPVALDGKPGEVAILVQVQERYLERFGSAGPFVGVQSDRLPYYYYVGATYQWNNFAGYGSQLEVRGDFSWTNSFGVSARYSDLYAFGPGWRFDLTLFYRREVTRRLGPIEAFGGSIGITRAITRSLRAFTRIDLIRSQLSVTFLRLNGPADTPTLQDNTTTGKLVLGIMWDRRTDLEGVPNPLMPQKGWLLSATTAYAPPIFGNHFFALSAQAMGLLPIKLRDQTFTLIGNLRYDHGFPIGQPALPAVERFFAGGDTTTRGYGTDQLKTEIIAAEVPPLGDGSGFRIIPQGGNVRFLSTVEFQFPIAKSFLGLPVQWVGSVFWDVGAILSDVRLVQQSDFKHGIGISLLRLLTPFGPLSLEYAYPLNQSLAEQTWKTAPWYAHFPGRIHFNWQIPLGRF